MTLHVVSGAEAGSELQPQGGGRAVGVGWNRETSYSMGLSSGHALTASMAPGQKQDHDKDQEQEQEQEQ